MKGGDLMMARVLISGGMQRVWTELAVAVAMFAIVITACLIGIWSRPVGLLASLWPANPVLLGLLLRWPAAGRPLPLFGAVAAYICADLSAGSGIGLALGLNAANLVSVSVAYAILSPFPAGVRRMRQPLALVWVVLASVAAGLSAALLGAFVSQSDPGGRLIGFAMWSVAESVNYLAFLPVFLTAPGRDILFRKPARGAWRKSDLLPAASVIISCILAFWIGGPGAVAVPVLALLWCGMVYPVFPTTLLTLFFGSFALSVLAEPILPTAAGEADQTAIISLRIGVAVVALMPVLLALLTQSRNEATARLRHLANHDGLTGIRNRSAFLDRAGVVLANARSPLALLVLDLDRFKEVNDTWGHAAGDRVLVETVRRLSGILRSGDQFARLGGEEFAILLTDCSPTAAKSIAERLRRVVEAAPILLDESRQTYVTISIGMVQIAPPSPLTLAGAMALADRCLYAAKAQGRNRVVVSQGTDAASQMPIGIAGI